MFEYGNETDWWISVRKEFLNLGAGNKNDLSPAFFGFTIGVHRSVAEQDPDDLEGVFTVSIAGRSEDKVLANCLEACVAILKCILCLIEIQCSRMY